MMRRQATLCGFGAVLLWAVLALFTSLSGDVPPFQLAAICFAVGGVIGLIFLVNSRKGFGVLRQPLRVWALGVGGLFGYHFLYFSALQAAPEVEASLIAYLWPLMIVVASAALPGERLRLHHLGGALVGFAGAALIVTGGQGLTLQSQFAAGYAFAFAASFVWTGYSVLSRRFASVPTEVVAGFCAVASLLSAICHMVFETTVWPGSTTQWLAVLALGLGPLGFAFFLWDRGMKHGDIQVLGAASYAAPLLSTVVLIAVGIASLTPVIALACLLITGGALWAAKDMLGRPSRHSSSA